VEQLQNRALRGRNADEMSDGKITT